MVDLTDQLAYIDPVSGSLLLQAIAAGLLGVVWRVTSLFRRRRKAEGEALAERPIAPAQPPADQNQA